MEDVYFKNLEHGIMVTQSRFVVGSSTFPINGIVSAQVVKLTNWKLYGIILMALGALLLLSAIAFERFLFAYGLGFLVIGFLVFKFVREKYGLTIATAAGSVTALQSKDKHGLFEIYRALNDAVIKRG